MFKHWRISLYGNVQGVFMRRTVEREAKRLGLVGFVKNEEDGSVTIEIEGRDKTVKGFVEWLKSDNEEELHDIDRVEVDEGSFEAFTSFEIRE